MAFSAFSQFSLRG